MSQGIDYPRHRPLEIVAYDCYLTMLSNPEVRNRGSDLETIARLSFSAARAFAATADMEAKNYKEGRSNG